MSDPGSGATPAADAVVRPFDPDDEATILDLGGGTGDDRRAWFDWYRATPALDHVPVAVVERQRAQAGESSVDDGGTDVEDGERTDRATVVAALPFAAVGVRAGGDEALAMAPGELWTARGRADDADALERRAIEGAADYYATADVATRPAVFVTDGAPEPEQGDDDGDDDGDVERDGSGNDDGDAMEEMGVESDERRDDAETESDDDFWEPREEERPRHRIQRHGALLGQRLPGPIGRVLGAPVGPVKRPLRRWRDRRVDFDTDAYVVAAHDGVPAATLSAGYRAHRPASTHVVLDADFFRWWAARPDRGPLSTYVVYRHSDVAAALVVERDGTATGVDAATIHHVLPLVGDPARPAAVAAGMERALADHADAATVRTANPQLPESVAHAYGLRRADGLPTSLFVPSSDRRIGIRPAVDGQRTVGSRPIGEIGPFLWSLF